jgi:hypothetical protein
LLAAANPKIQSGIEMPHAKKPTMPAPVSLRY